MASKRSSVGNKIKDLQCNYILYYRVKYIILASC